MEILLGMNLMVTEIQLAGYYLLVWIGNLWENVYRTFSQMTQQLPANTAWCINHSWCLVLFRFVRLKQASLNCIVRYPYRRGILSANFHIIIQRKEVAMSHVPSPSPSRVSCRILTGGIFSPHQPDRTFQRSLWFTPGPDVVAVAFPTPSISSNQTVIVFFLYVLQNPC